MKVAKGLLLLFYLWIPSVSLFMDEKLTSYRVPDGSIEIDGTPDSIWFPIKKNSIIFIEAGNCSQIVLNGEGNTLQMDPCQLVSPGPDGDLTIESVYDSKFVYFFVTVRNSSNRWKTSNLDNKNPMKNEIFGIFLDPHLWDTIHYKSAFSEDANGKWPGSSAHTLVVFSPVLAPEPSFFLYDRIINNEFEQRDWDTFKTHYPGFQYAKATHPQTYNVAMEIRIPRYAKTLSLDSLAGKGIYFTVGYNAPYGGNFLWYQWSKHYKKVDCIDGQNIGPCGPEDSTHFSPEYSREGWGQLYFHEKMITIDSSLTMPWHLNLANLGIIQPGVISVEKPKEIRVMRAGSILHFPDFQGSQLIIFNQNGRVLEELNVQNHRVDLNELQLEAGYYFGLMGNQKFSFVYGL